MARGGPFTITVADGAPWALDLATALREPAKTSQKQGLQLSAPVENTDSFTAALKIK